MGATLQCSCGSATSILVVLPDNKVMAEGPPAANIMDKEPMVNILPFGSCMSPANPSVASATAAAYGVPTPAGCAPANISPWAPGAVDVLIAKLPALDNVSTCMCAFGGQISIVNPATIRTMIP
jgi:hypothetical protein